MKIRGDRIVKMIDYVINHFPQEFNFWIEALPEGSKNILINQLDSKKFYPITEGYQIPLNKMIEVIYKNDLLSAAEDLGKYCAISDMSLFQKFISRLLSPQPLLKNSSAIISQFYSPISCQVETKNGHHATLKITEFNGMNVSIEHSIASYLKTIISESHTIEVKYDIRKSLAIGDKATEIDFRW